MPTYRSIKKASVFTQFVDKLIAEGKPIGFDIEAGYEGAPREKLALMQYHPDWRFVSFSFTNSTAWACTVPLFFEDEKYNVDDKLQVIKDLWRLLNNTKVIAHNAAYELKGTARLFRENLLDDAELGDEVKAANGHFPIFSDSMIEAFLLQIYPPLTVPGGVGKGLKDLTKFIFGHEMTHFADLFPKTESEFGPATKRPTTVNFRDRNGDHPLIVEYCCEDALWCLELHKMHYPMITEGPATPGTLHYIYKQEMSILPVFVEYEEVGLKLDWNLISEKAKEVQLLAAGMQEEILDELSERIGKVININLGSAVQVREVLYNTQADGGLGLTATKLTGKGIPSTDAKTLDRLSKSDETVKKILQYREIVKLHGSYLRKYETELHYADTDRAYPNHNQLGAATGRISVDQVSYQQWPWPYEYKLKNGREFYLSFKDLLIPPPGYRVMGFDFSQVELRFMSGLAHETTMINAFVNGVDIHKQTASSMFHIPIDEVTTKDRQRGKALANDELVLTPSGWALMGDMRVGDEVVVPQGGKALVEAVYPQGVRQLYRVTFDDGTSVEADGDHRWAVFHHKRREQEILTTSELLSLGVTDSNGAGRAVTKWRVEAVSPLEFDGESDLPIAPYLLGALLGDGSISQTSVGISNHLDDREIIDHIRTLLPESVLVRQEGGKSTAYVFTSKVAGAYRNELDRALKELGLRGSKTEFNGRFGVRSYDKYVPRDYLFASPEQRLELLRGLLDTDGYATANGRVDFVSVSEQLVEDVEFLARSLGGRATRQKPRRGSYEYLGEKREGAIAYRCLVDLPEGVNPFRLARKAQRVASWTKTKRTMDKKIVSIVPTREYEATCITVSHEEHQFITRGMTRTMNTVNFAITYGMGAAALAETLSTPDDVMSKEDGQKMLNAYFAGFPKLKGWNDAQVLAGHEQGYVETLFGRKYYLWEYKSDNGYIRSSGDRLAVNGPVQGGAADYLKTGQIRLQKRIKAVGWQEKLQPIMAVHDALVFYVSNELSDQEVIDLVDPCVAFPISQVPAFAEEYPDFPPIRTDWEVGPRYGAKAEILLDENRQITGYEVGKSHFEKYEDAEALLLEETEKRTRAWTPWENTPEAYLESLPEEAEDDEPEWTNAKPIQVDITMLEMPEREKFPAFKEYILARPGRDRVVLHTPAGSVPLGDDFKIIESDKAQISILLGGASVTFRPLDTDIEIEV